MSLATRRIEKARNTLGGKMMYLECEDNVKLLEFYKRNGFIEFGRRHLDTEEENLTGEYLVQLLTFF